MDITEKLLQRAELLAERGQFKMLNITLDEIDKRAEQSPLDADQIDRYNALDEKCSKNDNAVTEKCHKCNGSGRYFHNGQESGRCYACVGKGFQTARDMTREKNYYARLQNKQASAPAYVPEF